MDHDDPDVFDVIMDSSLSDAPCFSCGATEVRLAGVADGRAWFDARYGPEDAAGFCEYVGRPTRTERFVELGPDGAATVCGRRLTLVPGVDKKIDKLQGRRVVATNPPIDVGVAENALVWAPHDQNTYAKLFSADGDGAIDAIRAVPLGGTKGIAVTFRRGNAIYVGAAKGDSVLTPEGSLVRIAGLGQVGSPAITTSGDTIVVAWSDRATAQDPWQVRWTKLKI